MTILSWPHWSYIPHFSTNIPARDFHDYFVMAPLKRFAKHHGDSCSITSMTILSWPHWSALPSENVVIASLTSMTILSWPHWSSYKPSKTTSKRRTSMTILSWPHWSSEAYHDLVYWAILPWLFCHGPIEAFECVCDWCKGIQLPWLFCHGPIEACGIRQKAACHSQTSMTILSWPHWSTHFMVLGPYWENTSMTILSWPHWSDPALVCMRCSLLTSMTILSWPHWSMKSQGYSYPAGENFHDYFVMAPLKHTATVPNPPLQLGTSMTILSWPHWSANHDKK